MYLEFTWKTIMLGLSSILTYKALQVDRSSFSALRGSWFGLLLSTTLWFWQTFSVTEWFAVVAVEKKLFIINEWYHNQNCWFFSSFYSFFLARIIDAVVQMFRFPIFFLLFDFILSILENNIAIHFYAQIINRSWQKRAPVTYFLLGQQTKIINWIFMYLCNNCISFMIKDHRKKRCNCYSKSNVTIHKKSFYCIISLEL